jgi:hypothetical protein
MGRKELKAGLDLREDCVFEERLEVLNRFCWCWRQAGVFSWGWRCLREDKSFEERSPMLKRGWRFFKRLKGLNIGWMKQKELKGGEGSWRVWKEAGWGESFSFKERLEVLKRGWRCGKRLEVLKRD